MYGLQRPPLAVASAALNEELRARDALERSRRVLWSDSTGTALVRPTGQLAGVNMLPRWRSALSAVRAGTRNARLMVISDSTGVGAFSLAGTPNYYANNNFSANWVNYLAARIAAAGWKVNTDAVFGDQTGGQGPAQMALFDTRQTFGANWSIGIQTSGGNNIINTTLDSVQPRTFTPVNPFDTIELIYLANAIYGQAVLSVDGGVTPLGAVINQATGGSIRVKTTRTVPRGNYTVDFRRSGTGAASINAVCIRTYDSTQRSVDILNVSRGGTTTLLESENSAYYHPLSVNADSNMYAPDLVIICLDINNWINNYAAGTYDLATTTTHSFQLQKMIDAFRPTADVILMTGAPSAAARATLAIQAGITRATRVIAAANNVPLIDINAAFGSYLAAQSAYYTTADDAHPSALGYAAMADIVAASPELIF